MLMAGMNPDHLLRNYCQAAIITQKFPGIGLHKTSAIPQTSHCDPRFGKSLQTSKPGNPPTDRRMASSRIDHAPITGAEQNEFENEFLAPLTPKRAFSPAQADIEAS